MWTLAAFVIAHRLALGLAAQGYAGVVDQIPPNHLTDPRIAQASVRESMRDPTGHTRDLQQVVQLKARVISAAMERDRQSVGERTVSQ